MVDSDELYNRVVCALTHRIDVCDGCMRCARTDEDDSIDVRMNIIEDLADYMGKELPWEKE